MRIFTLIWLGETVSSVGSGLTVFALSVWVYELTRSATFFGLISFLAATPSVLLLPLIGALVDRWDQRSMMIWSNVCAGLSSLTVAALAFNQSLTLWSVLALIFLKAVCVSFIEPSLLKSARLLIPTTHLGRASGLIQSTQASVIVFSPLLAGLFLPAIGVQGVALLDFTTYLFALATLLPVRLPAPETGGAGVSAKHSLSREALDGWAYIIRRRGLLFLLLYFSFINFFIGFVLVLMPPLVLNLSNARALGVVLSCGGGGFLLGSILVVIRGTPRKHVRAIIGFGLLSTLCGMVIGLRPSVPLIAVAYFAMNLCIPVMNACTQVIWLRKTPVGLQGRVFAVRRLLVVATMPVSYLIAGPLADRVFEPLANGEGPLSLYAVALTGGGAGRGFGLTITAAGALTLAALLASSASRSLRRVEVELPDADDGATAVEGLSEKA